MAGVILHVLEQNLTDVKSERDRQFMAEQILGGLMPVLRIHPDLAELLTEGDLFDAQGKLNGPGLLAAMHKTVEQFAGSPLVPQLKYLMQHTEKTLLDAKLVKGS